MSYLIGGFEEKNPHQKKSSVVKFSLNFNYFIHEKINTTMIQSKTQQIENKNFDNNMG